MKKVILCISIFLFAANSSELHSQKNPVSKQTVEFLNKAFGNHFYFSQKDIQKTSKREFLTQLKNDKNLEKDFGSLLGKEFSTTKKDALFLILNFEKDCENARIYFTSSVNRRGGVSSKMYISVEPNSKCAELLSGLGEFMFIDSKGKEQELCHSYTCSNSFGCLKNYVITDPGKCPKSSCSPHALKSCVSVYIVDIWVDIIDEETNE